MQEKILLIFYLENALKKISTYFLILIFSSFVIVSCSDKKDSDNAKTEINVSSVKTEAQAANKPALQTKSETETPESNTKVYTAKTVNLDPKTRTVDFTWEEDGKEMSYKELVKDKGVIINVWGTWCPPCRAEIPDMVEIYNELNPKGFEIIGIAVERDRNNAMKLVKSFAEQNGIKYRLLVETDGQLTGAYQQLFGQISGVPTSYFFNKKGEFKDLTTGMLTKPQFMEKINKIM